MHVRHTCTRALPVDSGTASERGGKVRCQTCPPGIGIVGVAMHDIRFVPRKTVSQLFDKGRPHGFRPGQMLPHNVCTRPRPHTVVE